MCKYCERRKDISFSWDQPKLPLHNGPMMASLSGNVLENEKWDGEIHDYQTAQPQMILTSPGYFGGEGIGTIYIPIMYCPYCGRKLGKKEDGENTSAAKTNSGKKLKNLYVIVGRSGTGKTALVQALREKYGYIQAESYTDRPKRTPDETGHHFVTPAEYDMLEQGDKVLETVFDGYRYTMTINILENSDLIILDIPGIVELREIYKEGSMYVIGIDCDRSLLKSRMIGRGEDEERIRKRMEHDDENFWHLHDEGLCDIMIENNGSIEEFIKKAADQIRRNEEEKCQNFK